MEKRNREKWNYGERKSRDIPIAVNNLVVCCGEQTEYNYFSKAGDCIKGNYSSITGINFEIVVDAVDPLNMAKTLRKDLINQNNKDISIIKFGLYLIKMILKRIILIMR